MSSALVLRGGRVLDPGQGVDGVMDVVLQDGKVAGLGVPAPEGAEVLDVAGRIVSPGFFDIHVHAYGGISFGDPDTVGVNHGTTSMVDAGGPGAFSWEEFKALVPGRHKTDIYAYLYLGASGISGGQAGSGARGLVDVPVRKLIDIVDGNRDVIRGVKMGAFGGEGAGPVKMAKGLANILGLPLYVHIGDFHKRGLVTVTDQVLDTLEAGDIVTHCFSPGGGNLFGKDGQILPQALAARDRGVCFDVGFGSYGFDFNVAERVLAAGIVPSTISSDLQQINVTGPAYSLMRVMSNVMALGLSLSEAVVRVTANPANQLGLADRIGSLQTGRAADVTVFEVETSELQVEDCNGNYRTAKQLLRPYVTVKGGEVIWPNLELAEAESNWNFEAAISRSLPDSADLDHEQRGYLGASAASLRRLDDWEYEGIYLTMEAVRKDRGLDVRRATLAVLDSFLTVPFTPPAAFLLEALDRDFALHRLEEASAPSAAGALQGAVA